MNDFVYKLETIAFTPDSRIKQEDRQAAMIALSVYHALDKHLGEVVKGFNHLIGKIV